MPRDRQSIVFAERRNLHHRRAERGEGGWRRTTRYQSNETHRQRSISARYPPPPDAAFLRADKQAPNAKRSEVTCTRSPSHIHTHVVQVFGGDAAANANGGSTNVSTQCQQPGLVSCLRAQSQADGGKKKEQKEEVGSC